MFVTSMASSLPTLPSLPGISKKRRPAAVPPDPSSNATLRGTISMHDWLSGMINCRVGG